MMNFSPFGSPFSTSIPNIHQFASKLSQDGSFQDDTVSLTNRYTANGIPSFTQHHHATTAQQHQQFFAGKRQQFDQQNFDVFSVRTQPNNGENNNKEKDVQSSLNSSSWPNLATSGNVVADYLSQLPSSSLPLSLHEFLKYSAETLKKDATNEAPTPNSLTTINTAHLHPNLPKKKKKKKQEKEKKPKPKPGEIRLTTALDGSTLYCCPECHMALPERDLLEQHLTGHNMERRFVCDICGAALKRKDHLTRHKQSHNPERPFVCSVCLKAFKRKEQLTLHFVIHSGEKRHVCAECGKGFYRKDHLRKHTRSHIARRVKAELSQQGAGLHGIP